MTEASAASQLASVMRAATSHQARASRESVKPEQVADQLKLSQLGDSSTASFDATGQILPSAKSTSKSSSTSNFLDLLA